MVANAGVAISTLFEALTPAPKLAVVPDGVVSGYACLSTLCAGSHTFRLYIRLSLWLPTRLVQAYAEPASFSFENAESTSYSLSMGTARRHHRTRVVLVGVAHECSVLRTNVSLFELSRSLVDKLSQLMVDAKPAIVTFEERPRRGGDC